LAPHIAKNRETLKKVPKWITDDDYQHSVFQYGLPAHVKHLIDEDVGTDPTYNDVFCYLFNFLDQPLHYLEIGVSVGKSLYQTLSCAKNARVTALELESINPTFGNLLTKEKELARWDKPTSSGSVKQAQRTYTRYKFQTNKFFLFGNRCI